VVSTSVPAPSFVMPTVPASVLAMVAVTSESVEIVAVPDSVSVFAVSV